MQLLCNFISTSWTFADFSLVTSSINILLFRDVIKYFCLHVAQLCK